jgi:3-keto-5-aminohexanoate cleavage enzyme
MQEPTGRMMEERRSHWEEDFPVIFEPKIPTMDKKLVIEAAIPGWLPVEWWSERGITEIPPTTIEGQAEAIIECVKAGASVIHTHPRDPEAGKRSPLFGPAGHKRHAELLTSIMDLAFKEVDFITAHHSWTFDLSKSRDVDYITLTNEVMEMNKAKGVGNRDVQASLIMTEGAFTDKCVMSTRAAQIGTEFMEANGIKPMFSMQSFAFPKFRRVLFDNGLAKWRPFWVAIQMGKHNDDQNFADPWSYIQTINNISMFRQSLPEDTFLALHPAGRNWLPVAVIGILYGVELIRVGIEDQFWLYPHRDDISRKASDTVKMIANIARDLGREIATVDEARERLGIKLTMPKKF